MDHTIQATVPLYPGRQGQSAESRRSRLPAALGPPSYLASPHGKNDSLDKRHDVGYGKGCSGRCRRKIDKSQMPHFDPGLERNESGLAMRVLMQKSKASHRIMSAESTMSDPVHFEQSRAVNSILYLQRTIGNQALQRILQTNAEKLEVGLASTASPHYTHDFSQSPIKSKSSTIVQEKVTVSSADDIHEQEADRVSDQVMHTPEPHPPRACACGGGCSCYTERPRLGPERMQAKHIQSSELGQTEAPPLVREVLASPGQSLDTATRSLMEERFGYDFSRVRIHADGKAAEAAQTIHALAYTAGDNVVFGAGQYSSGTSKGRRLLAHELTHVIQQQAAAPKIARSPGDGSVVAVGTTNPVIQRQLAHKSGQPGFGHKPHALSPAEVKKAEAFDADWIS